MSHLNNLKDLSFLIYGLGSTGISVINFFKKKGIKNFFVWDDNKHIRRKYRLKCPPNLKKTLSKVDYVILSPGISLIKPRNKNFLNKFKNKIITDIDLLFLTTSNFKSIVVTGSNGKSTTCKMIYHLLRKNSFDVQLGGNIGNPVLNFKIKKDTFLIIEASSFQLSHSKFIRPDFAILLNITNDHLDWHGSMKNYVNSKFKLFKIQRKKDFALVDKNYLNYFRKKKFASKLISIKSKNYLGIKNQIDNTYLNLKINDDNMSTLFTLSKLLKINKKSFIESMKSFSGLPHRFEIFYKQKNITFINDSKATTLQAAKFAITSLKNIFWIVGGLPKEKDNINLNNYKKNITKAYIIGKSTSFFKKQLHKKVKFTVSKTLNKAIVDILGDIKTLKNKHCVILLSPGAASFDQFKNFEKRGNEFKKLCKLHA